jgi:hypothetical protein
MLKCNNMKGLGLGLLDHTHEIHENWFSTNKTFFTVLYIPQCYITQYYISHSIIYPTVFQYWSNTCIRCPFILLHFNISVYEWLGRVYTTINTYIVDFVGQQTMSLHMSTPVPPTSIHGSIPVPSMSIHMFTSVPCSYNIFLVTDRSIYCHMTRSDMNYLLYFTFYLKYIYWQ